VIKGWDIAVSEMRVGEKSLVKLAPEYAYGAAGSQNIPPNATLLFEIELISFSNEKDVSKAKDGSILKKIIKDGEGYETPNEDTTVTINISLSVAGKVIEKKDNYTFPIDEDCEMPALEHAIKSMKKGEHAIVSIAQHAIDKKDITSKNITSNDKFVYDIELVNFIKEKGSWQMTVEEKFQNCEAKRADGNDLYRAGKVRLALKRYKKALEGIDSDYQMAEEDKARAKVQKVPLNLNIAACAMAMKDYKEAIERCNKALEIEKNNTKALLRRAKCFNLIDKWIECQQDLDSILLAEPENVEAKKELAVLKKKQAEQDKKESKAFRGMFGKLSKLEEEDLARQKKLDEEEKAAMAVQKEKEEKEKKEEKKEEKKDECGCGDSCCHEKK